MRTVIRGYGWRYTLFPTTGPTKADLDKLFPDRPVLLIAIDVHSAWINSKALEIAGVNAKTPDPVPGFSYFQRDPKTGEPTGWVVESSSGTSRAGQTDASYTRGPDCCYGRVVAELFGGRHYGRV